MTEEQINKRITEITGLWDYPYSSDTRKEMDFCNDLNAMHEAENTLAGKQFSAYTSVLNDIEGSLWGIRATARQRAEAFLRTLGNWEDGK
jgi:hypothetical protein